jgi:small subunit ribosomal protein S17
MSELKATPNKLEKVGVVVSDKMDRTRVVLVKRIARHPLFSKRITKRNKFYAHDEENVSRLGDTVRIRQCRPLSKMKRWKVMEIVQRGDHKESGVDNGTVTVNT